MLIGGYTGKLKEKKMNQKVKSKTVDSHHAVCIVNALENIKELCYSILLAYKLQVGNMALDIAGKIKKIVYSPTTDVVYVYVGDETMTKIVTKELMVILLQNKVRVELDFQLFENLGVVEIKFGDGGLIKMYENQSLKTLITI